MIGRHTAPATAAPTRDPELPEIQAEQVRLLMAGLPASLAASVIVAGVLAYVQWPVVEQGAIAIWLTAVVLISALRLGLALGYARRRAAGTASSPWLAAFVATTALAGASWGAGAWALYPPDDLAHQAFLGVLVAGLTAGAVTSLSASLAATFAFLLLALAPLAVRFLLSPHEPTFALGFLTFLFFAVTAIGARRTNASMVQNVRLRLQLAAQVKALTESEERARKLAMVAARTDNAVIITDRDARIEWVNDAFTRITGYVLEEVAGRTPGSVLQGPDTDPQAVERIRGKLRLGQAFQEELVNYGKDGRHYWVSIEVQPIVDEAGEVQQFMAVERDVTESRLRQQQLEEARDRAEEASRTKSRFLAMMSHEVRTPLNGVLGSLSLLQDTRLDPEQHRYVETSRRSADWLLSVINDILDFSRVEAGRLELEPSPFRIRQLVQGVVAMLEPRASEKAIAILGEIEPAVPDLAIGDAAKIRHVLLNLAGNSVKFTSRGEVRIGVSLLEESEKLLRLRFAVSDTGAGIALEQRDKIFEEFWTSTTDTGAEGAGTGLGLAISRQLVQLLGGEIELESQAGAGSRFWFDLPLAPAPPGATLPKKADDAAQAMAADATQSPPLRGRALIAEDNSANQLIIQSLLGRFGIDTDVVSNGVEAVAAVRTRPYDLVLMDVGMPELDGVAATRAIRALEGPAARVPIVAVTAHVMSGEREMLLAEGMDGYLPKPIDRGALLACLSRWLPAAPADAPVVAVPQAAGTPPPASRLIDRGVLEQLLEDVGPENARAVVDAFVGELQRQAVVLRKAADDGSLAALAQAAHRLKGSAASFGAMPLSRAMASVEQAAKSERSEAAIGATPECLELARTSQLAMEALRDEIFATADAGRAP